MKHLLCASVNRVLEAYHDGELPVEEQIVVETHLSECYLCASEAKSLRMVRDALRASADVPADAPVFGRQQYGQYGLTAAHAGAYGDAGYGDAEETLGEPGRPGSGKPEEGGGHEPRRPATACRRRISRVKAERAQSRFSHRAAVRGPAPGLGGARGHHRHRDGRGHRRRRALLRAEGTQRFAGGRAVRAGGAGFRSQPDGGRQVHPRRRGWRPSRSSRTCRSRPKAPTRMLAVSGVVTQDGRLAFLSLVSSSPYSQAEDRRVMDQVSATRFEPATRGGARSRQLRMAP